MYRFVLGYTGRYHHSFFFQIDAGSVITVTDNIDILTQTKISGNFDVNNVFQITSIETQSKKKNDNKIGPYSFVL